VTDRVTRDWQTGQVESRVLEERLGRARRKLATGRDARMRQGIAFSEKQLLAIASPRGRLAAVDGYLPPASSFRKRTDVDLEPPADRRGVSAYRPFGDSVTAPSFAEFWEKLIASPFPPAPFRHKIASVFIVIIVVTSLVSRTLRSTELRVLGIEPDPLAQKFIDDAARGNEINIIANRPGPGDRKEYEDKLREARESHHLTPDDPVLFLEVARGDASEFSEVLLVRGVRVNG